MFIAFLPIAEAHEILEELHEQEAAAAEYEADLGSSFFYGGASSWDASWMARQHTERAQEDFDQSEEAPLYYARLETARFMTEATCALVVVSAEDEGDWRIFTPHDALRVPEFYPSGPKALVDLFILPTPITEDDIPF